MTKVIMGIGIPGSGKSTVLKKFSEKNGYLYICPDDIRAELTGDAGDQSKNREVWAAAYGRTSAALKDNQTIVFDATFANQNQRRDFISFAKENGADKIQGVYLDVPLSVATERNIGRERQVPDYAMERMDKNLRDFPPELADGIDTLVILNEDGELSELKLSEKEGEIHREFGRSAK